MQNLQPPPDDISSSSSTTHAQGDAVATAAAAAAAATAAPATQSKPMISEKRRFQNRESQRKYSECSDRHFSNWFPAFLLFAFTFLNRIAWNYVLA
jgi:ADP-ribosylglycohydrolase